MRKSIESRGWEKFNSDNEGKDCENYPKPGTFRDFFVVQADKSTCQSYNLKVGIFGYQGVPTVDAGLLLDEIAEDYGMFSHRAMYDHVLVDIATAEHLQ